MFHFVIVVKLCVDTKYRLYNALLFTLMFLHVCVEHNPYFNVFLWRKQGVSNSNVNDKYVSRERGLSLCNLVEWLLSESGNDRTTGIQKQYVIMTKTSIEIIIINSK